MKKYFCYFPALVLAFAAFGCTESEKGSGSGPANPTAPFIGIEQINVSGVSAQFKFVPTNPEQEYCFYLVEKAEYDPSNIPGDAQYVTGEYTATFTDLTLGSEYCVAVADEYEGYTDKLDFKTLGSAGTTDPDKHPSDFIIKDIPMKQKRSAKRGVSGNLQSKDDPALLGKGVCWDYNWGSNSPANVPEMDAVGMTFYPMAWSGLNDPAVANIKAYAATHPKAYILGFNEPNLTDQANMTPTACAPRWKTLVAQAKTTGLKLVSPALNYGTLPGYSDPEKWMDEFLAIDGVSKDDFEAIALHCYMPNAGGMRAMIHKFEKYGKPVWMTEFCHANSGITKSLSTQMAFMSGVLDYLETEPMVEAYSWFIARGWDAYFINLISGNQLTELGKLYVNFSSFDKTCYYTEGEPIPAAHYVKHNMSDVAYPAEWGNTLAVTTTTDSYGDLMLSAYQPGAWVEYQLDLGASKKYGLAIRYNSSRVDGEFDLSIDGKIVKTIALKKNGIWETFWTDLDLTTGKHTLRLTCKSGSADINWFYLD